MASTLVSQAATTVYQSTGFVVMGRILRIDSGLPIVRADITTLTRKLVKANDVIATDVLVIADSIFDTLQTNPLWDLDTDGFNVRDIVTADKVTVGDAAYELWYEFASGTLPIFRWKREIYSRSVPGI